MSNKLIGTTMLNALLGKKIGMTQVFDMNGNVVPVTVVDVAHWLVTQIKKADKNGYSAVQVGWLKERFRAQDFSLDWLKNKNNYFTHIKELTLENDSHDFALGQEITFDHTAWDLGQLVQVTGTSKGLGFQGVTKRWRFGRGPSTHGSKFHRRPGSIGHMRREGEVIKGKKLPGRFGNDQTTIKGLRLVQADKDKGCVFIKGALPGKKDSIVLIKKQG